MTQNLWKYQRNEDLTDYTLIVPSVAVGNVGQLACDLLISTFAMKKLASVYSPALIPVLGYDPYDLNSNDLSRSCELYTSSKRRFAVLQIRAPILHKNAKRFLEDLMQTFKEKNVGDIVVLTSSFAHENKLVQSTQFRYIAHELSPHKAKAKEMGWTEHEHSESELKIFGGGFASLLYEICKELSLPCFILFKFCSEGDNVPDAYDMIRMLNEIIPIFNNKKDIDEQLLQPVSWKLMFGGPPPQGIY